MMTYSQKFFFVFLILIAPINFIYSQTGSLDFSFDTDGRVTTAIGSGADGIYDIAIQADGKIVAVGFSENGTDDDLAIARYNTDGSLDNSFDSDGIVTVDVGSGDDIGYGVAIQADGKIVVVGSANTTDSDFLILRLNSDGSPDNSFDSDGMVTTDFFGNYDIAYDVEIQADGKIVAGGAVFNDSIYNFGVARYNTDGSLDNSFDSDGKVNTLIAYNAEGKAVEIQSDGKIVLAGHSLQSDFYNAFAVVRYNTDGSLDNTFDSDGIVETANISPYGDEGQGMAIQNDGKIVVVGKATPVGPLQFAVVRYNTDGSLDNTWNGTGIVTTAFGSSWDEARDVLIQPDGKVLVGGMATISSQRFALALYNSDGSLDPGFDSDGKVNTPVSGSSSIWGIALQVDGKIVAGGQSSIGGQDFALARYGDSGFKGVEEAGFLNGSLSIYPNPVTDQFTVRYEMTVSTEITIQLLDLHGKVIQTYLVDQYLEMGVQEHKLMLPEGLASGNYFVMVSSEQDQIGLKLVKQ